MSDKKQPAKLTPKQIDTMATAQNRQELLRQQSFDKLAKATKQALKEARRGKIVILLLITLVGLFASSANVQAQQSNHSYLPIFRQDPPPATFDLRVMRVNPRNTQGGCVNPLAPVTAMQGAICPLPGDYISLVADNPSSIALGGRQGDGSDAAWEGETSEFSLIEPSQIIADADRINLEGVTGYIEAPGLFTAPSANYTVLKIGYTNSTVGAAQTEPSLSEQADFHQTLEKMLDEGQIFDVDFAGDMEFWDRYGLVRLRPSACGVSHAVWVPEVGRTSFLADRFPPWIMQGGYFEPAGLNQCMGAFRWVKIGSLMTVPEAVNLQNRVNTRRGGNVTPFQWVTDARGTVYAIWTVATGTVAYYGVKALNTLTPNPAMFLFVPTEMLNCVMVAGVKTCTITEGEPGQ